MICVYSSIKGRISAAFGPWYWRRPRVTSRRTCVSGIFCCKSTQVETARLTCLSVTPPSEPQYSHLQTGRWQSCLNGNVEDVRCRNASRSRKSVSCACDHQAYEPRPGRTRIWASPISPLSTHSSKRLSVTEKPCLAAQVSI